MNARTPLTSMFLPGWNVYNQNRIVTSENALAPTFLTHTRAQRATQARTPLAARPIPGGTSGPRLA